MESIINKLNASSTFNDKITRYVRENVHDLDLINLKDMTLALDVAPSTITKWAQKLGFDGIKELRNQIELELSTTNDQNDIGLIDKFKDQLTFIAKQDKAIKNLSNRLTEVRSVKLIANGASKAIAEMFAYRLRKQRYDVQVSNIEYEINLWLETSTVVPSVYIVISISGQNGYDYVQSFVKDDRVKDNLFIITAKPADRLIHYNQGHIINLLEQGEIQNGREISQILGLEIIIWKLASF